MTYGIFLGLVRHISIQPALIKQKINCLNVPKISVLKKFFDIV